MIRSLRRRFILSGMAAFGILLMLLMCGVGLTSYLQVENTADVLLESVLDGEAMRSAEPAPEQPPMFSFGYRLGRREGHVGYYSITADPQGEITGITEKGIWEPDYDEARSLAGQILSSGKEEGKTGSYKYRIRREDGGTKLVLLDNSIQIRMLANILRTTALLGAGCLALLFLILLPISSRVVHSYAANIEKQRQFITNAGHEIKTPVAIIMSNVDAMELLQGENKWSRNIRGQTERLSALLQRLLFMARIDERSVVLPNEELELNALLGAELESYGEMIAEKWLQLDCDLSLKLRMRGSRDYIRQLAHMLLDNAVQYANPGGSIRLRLERKRQRARILLENSVERLPDCPPEALFERFYRGDSARTQSGGYGVGLSAARAIAEMHRGRIYAEYDGEHRIRFIVELPLKA